MKPLLAARNIVKHFGGVVALAGVSFELRAGEIHALCGENGAGKSTLMKLLGGIYPYGTYGGDLLLNGRPVALRSARDAERIGIAVIHQELALFSEMTVAENLFMSRLPLRFGRIRWEKVQSQARLLLRYLQIDLDADARVRELSFAHQQLVEVARALAQKPSVLVLDEPTTALSEREVNVLLEILRRQRARGVACAYVSHRLDEVLQVADRVTVLRDGVTQGTRSAADTTPQELIRIMVGRTVADLYPRRRSKRGPPLLRVRDLSVAPRRGAPPRLRRLSFEVAAGEVLGLSGLLGAGRSELLMHLIGQYGERLAGHVSLRGKSLHSTSPQEALRNGMALVSDDRKRFGLVLDQSVTFNLSLASLGRMRRGPFIDQEMERVMADESIASLKIKIPGGESRAATLSGGNQQKVVIGKTLLAKPEVLLLDEPTRGIDIPAKLDVYDLINQLAAAGKGIILASSELPELVGMSDRILVLHEGQVAGVFERGAATQERLLAAAMGRVLYAS